MTSGYVYKFLDSRGNVLYVGMTMRTLDKRMREHFSKKGHLPDECYKKVSKIMYQEFESKSDVESMEKFYISYYCPKYNIKDKPKERLKVNIPKKLRHWEVYEYIDELKSSIFNIDEFIDVVGKLLSGGICGWALWKLLAVLFI